MRRTSVNLATARLNTAAAAACFFFAAWLAGCNSEILEKQAEQIRQQEIEIARQREEIQKLLAAQEAEERKRRDCSRAFTDYFEKAQAAADRDKAIALYREGLALCPDDEVAHYELGRTLAEAGRYREAEKELEAALRINPGFTDARRQLDAVRGSR
ncbi:MAG TPA: tetratricopeptide repeat protein [candidate division Zixibacteria bacterium]|nr:tetratricopeptide repeat protein [candidate division Zixibacteria bacterium]